MCRCILLLRSVVRADKPKENPKATTDAMKTLFIGRLSFSTTEEKIMQEYDEFGPIAKVCGPWSGSVVGVCASTG